MLSYTTNAPVVTPLRVGVLENYANDQWSENRPEVDYSRRTTVPLPSDIDSSVPRETYRISVDESRLEAPQIAAPTPLVSGDLDRGAVGIGPQHLGGHRQPHGDAPTRSATCSCGLPRRP